MNRGRFACAAILCASFAAGCAINPVSGEHEIILISEEKEAEIGEKAAKEIEQTVGLFDDPKLTRYVQDIGERLAKHSPLQSIDYRFYLVDLPEPNAFALPGGHIYVTRGLLAISNSEDEVAGVIGHEIGHVAARHFAQRDTAQKSVQLLSILAIAAIAVGGVTSSGPSDLPGASGLIGAFSAYSRSQEEEADEVGQDLAAQAGIDPQGLADFLRTLDKSIRLKFGASRYPGFFDTHPSTPERIADATGRAHTLRWERQARIAQNRAQFLEMLDGLVLGENPAEGVFEDSRFLHADLDFTVRFPAAWTYENTHAAVGAIAPRGDGYIVLELQDIGEDAEASAREFMEKENIEPSEISAPEIGGLKAFRAVATMRMPEGVRQVEFTWIPYGGRIFRFRGVGPPGRFRSYAGIFRSAVRSFRPLRPEERESILETRLRVVEALEGETLDELSQRTGNVWAAQETAVSNGFHIDTRFEAGQLVKIASRGVYEPRPPPLEPEQPAPHEPEEPAP